MCDFDQLPLFERPNDVPIPRSRARPPSGAVRLARCRPKRRTLCDDCISDIHVRGVLVAPLPRAVAWRLTNNDDNAVFLLCDSHKRLRRGE